MQLRVTRARNVYSDGKHNAFTTLAAFRGKNYLAFRSGSTHMAMDGQIVLLEQEPSGQWQEVRRFSLSAHDLRDPHLVVLNGRMLLYTMTRVQMGDEITTESYVCSTTDGHNFTELTFLENISALWGLTRRDDTLYASNYKRKADTTLLYPSLWKSTDGLHWDFLMEYPFPGNEVALDFDNDGSLWTLVRDSTFAFGAIPSLCQILPPYTCLQERSYMTFEKILALPIRLHGPMIKRLFGHTVIVGRTWDSPQRSNLRTVVYLWKEGQNLEEICVLPSGGDTSYSAWLDTTPGYALLSYYSSHEHRMALSFEEEAIPGHPSAEHCTAADIFLADICYTEHTP